MRLCNSLRLRCSRITVKGLGILKQVILSILSVCHKNPNMIKQIGILVLVLVLCSAQEIDIEVHLGNGMEPGLTTVDVENVDAASESEQSEAPSFFERLKNSFNNFTDFLDRLFISRLQNDGQGKNGETDVLDFWFCILSIVLLAVIVVVTIIAIFCCCKNYSKMRTARRRPTQIVYEDQMQSVPLQQPAQNTYPYQFEQQRSMCNIQPPPYSFLNWEGSVRGAYKQ